MLFDLEIPLLKFFLKIYLAHEWNHVREGYHCIPQGDSMEPTETFFLGPRFKVMSQGFSKTFSWFRNVL